MKTKPRKNECEHKTGKTLYDIGEFQIWRCTGGCGKRIITVDDEDGISRDYEEVLQHENK